MILYVKKILLTTVLDSHANILGAITNLGGGEFCTPVPKAPEKTSLNSVFLLCFQSALYIHMNDCCYIYNGEKISVGNFGNCLLSLNLR